MGFKIGEKVLFFWEEKNETYQAIVMKRLRVHRLFYKYELQLTDYKGGSWSITSYEENIKKITEPIDILKEML